jgi:hypothetical protein
MAELQWYIDNIDMSSVLEMATGSPISIGWNILFNRHIHSNYLPYCISAINNYIRTIDYLPYNLLECKIESNIQMYLCNIPPMIRHVYSMNYDPSLCSYKHARLYTHKYYKPSDVSSIPNVYCRRIDIDREPYWIFSIRMYVRSMFVIW